MPSIRDRLSDARRRSRAAAASGICSAHTSSVVIRWIDDLERQVGEAVLEQDYLDTLAIDIVTVENWLDAIESEGTSPIAALFDELARAILGSDVTIEVFAFASPTVRPGLRTLLDLDGSRITAAVMSCGGIAAEEFPLLGLTAHEAAHVDPDALRLSDSARIEQKRLSEVQCDLIALALLGPAFALAFVAYLPFVRDPLNPPTTEKHPAYVIRAVLLDAAAAHLLENPHRNRVARILGPLVAQRLNLPSVQEQALTDLAAKVNVVRARAARYKDRDVGRRAQGLIVAAMEGASL